MSNSNKNHKQLFSLALVLGMWSPCIHASNSIKIDEQSFQEMLKKKDKEGVVIEANHIKRKAAIIGRDLSNKLKDISLTSKKRLNVIIALKTNDLNLKPLNSSGQVNIDENGEQKAIIDGKEVSIELLDAENRKILSYQKKATELRNKEVHKALKKFTETYDFLGKRILDEIMSDNKDSFEIKLSKSEIMKIAQNKELILGIELALTPINMLSDAMVSTKVDPYAFYGNKGNGINIYMSEDGCPNPGFITNYSRLSGSTGAHQKNVSSIIRGVSPDSFLYCRGGYTLPYSSDANVEIQTHSWAYTATNNDYRIYDRDFDNRVISKNDAIFVAAGNTGNTSPRNVTSPAKGLNVITVGNYNDSTDAINSSSSYNNPQTKNQKPEIVAPGTTVTAGGYTFTGTSQATPHAAAFAADLMSNYTWMTHKPHLMKTVMLAGATKNITGGTDKVGVGGIDFWSANYNGSYNWWTNASYDYYKSHDSGTNNNILEWKTPSLSSGKKYRAVISWLNDGTYTYSHRTDSHPIGKDFDMSVYDPNGNYVCGSASWDNPYEICNFTASVSGQYMIRINRYANRDTSMNMSLAVAVNRY